MRNILSKIILSIIITMWLGFFTIEVWAYTQAPEFNDFANQLTDKNPDEYWRVETVFKLPIDRKKTLSDNMKCLLYPNSIRPIDCDTASNWWFLWDIIRVAWFVLIFGYIVIAWINLMLYPKDAEKVKNNLKSLLYIAYWGFILLWSTRILGTVLNVWDVAWSGELVQKLQEWPNSLFFKVLSFFKILAFFVAIIMMVVLWFKIMAANDPDKSKKTAKSIINIVLALILIKVIDFFYYIAQSSWFAQKSADFIIDISKILAYIIWATLMLMIFYAWFLMITDQWKEENFKKARNIIVSIVLWSSVLFLFLLILYQVFSEFA